MKEMYIYLAVKIWSKKTGEKYTRSFVIKAVKNVSNKVLEHIHPVSHISPQSGQLCQSPGAFSRETGIVLTLRNCRSEQRL